MRKKPPKLEPIERSVLEATAHIIGPHSTAAQVLKNADEHDGPVNFYMLGNTIIVEKIHDKERNLGETPSQPHN